MLEQGFVSAAAIAASVLFILSLGGLSNQEKAKRAVWYGIVGIVVVFTANGLGIGKKIATRRSQNVVLLGFHYMTEIKQMAVLTAVLQIVDNCRLSGHRE